LASAAETFDSCNFHPNFPKILSTAPHAHEGRSIVGPIYTEQSVSTEGMFLWLTLYTFISSINLVNY